MSTISATVVIEDPIGFHARPAGQIVKLVKESGVEVRIGRVGDKMVKANSPLGLMALKAKTGEQLQVEVDAAADTANAIIDQIAQFLKG